MSPILDDLKEATGQAEADQERRKAEAARAAQLVQEEKKVKAILAAMEFYTNKLLAMLKEAADKAQHELRLHYRKGNYEEEAHIHHIAALCRADGLKTEFDSYTSDYGDSAAPAIHTSYYLIISW